MDVAQKLALGWQILQQHSVLVSSSCSSRCEHSTRLRAGRGCFTPWPSLGVGCSPPVPSLKTLHCRRGSPRFHPDPALLGCSFWDAWGSWVASRV